MATKVIAPGDQVTKDPSNIKTYVVDWDGSNLAAGVEILASDWYVTGLTPSFVDDALSFDQDSILTAAEATTKLGRTVTGDNRATEIRLSGGTMNQVYRVTNQILTSETPSQTKQKSFRILVEQE